jgi:hypothetical protein
MSNERKITDEEIKQNLKESDDDLSHSSDFSADSSDEEYNPDSGEENQDKNNSASSSADAEVGSDESSNSATPPPQNCVLSVWSTPNRSFVPRHTITQDRTTLSLCKLNRSSDEMDCFLQLFPRSLIMFISQCTNKRFDILRRNKKKAIEDTDPDEIMLLLGCMLVMSYNTLPSVSDYWSHNKSMGNEAIKASIARNRFQLLLSKLYFNDPHQPAGSSKTYYIDEVIACLKHTFPKAREESPYQSIDESMAKFKGRSALKQYLPLKPIKRGIKIWERCDAVTGYTYDLNVYAGKQSGQSLPENNTLGERVVLTLSNTIRNQDVTLVFDRFFTSVHLLNTIRFPSVGTAISSRKNMPKFQGKLKRGEFQFLATPQQTLAARWQDSKEVVVLSNCHDATVGKANRKQKDGTKLEVACPNLICFYNKYMGGVDISDQKVGVYDFDRHLKKWWKKVFYKLLMLSVVNGWVLFTEITRKNAKLLQFLVPLAEKMMAIGKQNSHVKRKRSRGRPSKVAKLMLNIGDHLPIEGTTRRRCSRCATNKIEKRTKTICTMCQVPLCKQCFMPYHT